MTFVETIGRVVSYRLVGRLDVWMLGDWSLVSVTAENTRGGEGNTGVFILVLKFDLFGLFGFSCFSLIILCVLIVMMGFSFVLLVVLLGFIVQTGGFLLFGSSYVVIGYLVFRCFRSRQNL